MRHTKMDNLNPTSPKILFICYIRLSWGEEGGQFTKRWLRRSTLSCFLDLELDVVLRLNRGGALIILIVQQQAPTQPSHHNGMSRNIVVGMGECCQRTAPVLPPKWFGWECGRLCRLILKQAKRINLNCDASHSDHAFVIGSQYSHGSDFLQYYVQNSSSSHGIFCCWLPG